MLRIARRLARSPTDKIALDELLASGAQQVRVVARLLAIRHLGDGLVSCRRSVPTAVRTFDLTPQLGPTFRRELPSHKAFLS